MLSTQNLYDNNMSPEQSLYINGEWVEGVGLIKNISPVDTALELGSFSQASAQQLADSIQAARNAQPLWNATALEEKQRILHAIGQDMIDQSGYIGKIIAMEEGKTLPEGKGEVYRAGQFFQYYAAEVLRQMGELADSVRPNVTIEVTREAMGVVGIISPWNFPVATAVWKIAPALAYGNSVVWKPSNLTPASAVAVVKLIEKHGLPHGTLNLILGGGADIGNALAASSQVDAISFTGSVPTGRNILRTCSEHFTKCQLEMGSKNALVVMDDADMETAVMASVAGAFSGTGQKCTASSRLVVHASIHDAFVDALKSKMETLKVSHPFDEGVFMGSVASEGQLKSNLAWVKQAQSSGAELMTGGEQIEPINNGFYMSPTLFIGTKNDWDVNREEVFAPMACVIKVNDLEEAITTVNDTEFGLVSGVITNSLKNATLFKQKAQTGCVMVNLPTAGTDYHVPFGGRKNSSYGSREQGQYAKEFYTVVKTAYQKGQ